MKTNRPEILKPGKEEPVRSTGVLNMSFRHGGSRYTHFPVCFIITFFLSFLLCTNCGEQAADEDLVEFGMGHLLDNTDLQAFGEKLFFDTNLSTPPGQSCATCHAPEAGWTGPDGLINATIASYEGAVKGRFNNRKPPSAAYATFSPVFSALLEDGELLFTGGNFWDGRATGCMLGNAAADQAQQPFLNPVEQNMPDGKSVVGKVLDSEYAWLYRKTASDIWKIDDIASCKDADMQFGIIGLALAAFEHSARVNAFTSKYDYYLQGKVKLSPEEESGMELFRTKGLCAECHPMDRSEDGLPPLFTDFTYDNLGMPANPLNPWYTMGEEYNPEGKDWRDPGLGGFLSKVPHYAMFADESIGKHKVPTLRNVDLRPSPGFVKSYGHNGYFKSLESIVHFYNTRDVLPLCSDVDNPEPGVNCWPEPEIRLNINVDELGNLKLTPREEAAIVAFMRTLSDGFILPEKK